MGRLTADKNSCRWLVDKCRLPSEDCCILCKELNAYSSEHLKNNHLLWKGKCLRLSSSRGNENTITIQEAPTNEIPRKRMATVHFIAEPSKGSMYHKGRKRLRRLSLSEKSIEKYIQKCKSIDLNEPNTRRLVMKQLAEMGQDENAMSAFSLPNGGKSAAVISKQRNTVGGIINGAVLCFANGKATPGRLRRDGMRNALDKHLGGTPQPIQHQKLPDNPVLRALSRGTCSPCVPTRLTDESGGGKSSKQIKRIHQTLGAALLQQLLELNSNTERRPILAAVADMPRIAIHKATGVAISEREYTNIRRHARYPGKFQPVEKKDFFRQKVSTENIAALLHCLGNGSKLQRNAFGTKVIEACGGMRNFTIENIERSQSAMQIAAQFVVEMLDETESRFDGGYSIPENRCPKMERDSLARQCLKENCHEGKCKFTSPSSMSTRTVEQLVNVLTGPDIKKLSGLDDVKVEQGRGNFIALRKHVDSLFGIDNPVKAYELKRQVDDAENFLKLDFEKHVSKDSDYACACYTCGFFDEGEFFRIIYCAYYC